MIEDKSILELFRDRPAIDNFGYMLKCLSTYDAFNKKPGGFWNANDTNARDEGQVCLSQSISKILLMFRGNCPMIWSISSEGKITVKGNGWKCKKFHAHLHLSQWISDLGLPANY